MKKALRILLFVGIALALYIGLIMQIARIPGNVTGKAEYGPQITIWIEGANASIITMPDNRLLETTYAPFFSTAGFHKNGTPNWVARWIFGVDVSIADRLQSETTPNPES